LVRFGLGPFPELRSQLAVVRQAFRVGHTSARRSQVVHRESAWRYIGCARLNSESTATESCDGDAHDHGYGPGGALTRIVFSFTQRRTFRGGAYEYERSPRGRQ
jgi:hypothetical protein